MNTYTIQQLADLAGVSVRTLHHYDSIGLLAPARTKRNGYRQYSEKDLLTLQQILFFKELDFPLDEIKNILASPGFDMATALHDQRKLIELKKERLERLINTIDKTIQTITNDTTMDDKELYNDFNTEAEDQYAQEAKERWGNTEAYKQSQERYGKLTKEEKQKLKVDADIWMQHVAKQMQTNDPHSAVAQELIDQHYNSLRTFYEPNLELYKGLAEMYIADPRFAAYYEKYATGLAQWMHDAMIYYVETHK